MYAKAVITPPLGTSTVVDHAEMIHFVASLEVSEESTHDWAVELWYGSPDEPWESRAFDAPSAWCKVHNGSPQLGRTRRSYHLFLNAWHSFKFTLRFRPNATSPWIWIRDQSQTDDGQIIVRPSPGPRLERLVAFDTVFSGTDAGLSVKSVGTGVPGVALFDVSAPAPALSDEWSRNSMGLPLLLEHFYALVKPDTSWMGPRQGSNTFTVDLDCLIAGYLRSDGRHVVVLTVSGVGATTTYIGSENGRVILRSRNDSGEIQVQRAFVVVGENWQDAVDAAFKAARDLLGKFGITEDTAPAELEPLWRESWYDGLGFCTWNSLGRELSEERILNALQDLFDKGITISTVIIDDNWQSLDSNRRWDRFEANEHFPNGLVGLTREIRRRFRGIKHIAVWHAVIGYWEGISPDGWIAANYKCTTVKWHGGHSVLLVNEEDIHRLYNDFYRFLVISGVDSVKCDVQSSLSEFEEAADRNRLSHAYQDAFRINSFRYFSGKVIYCMALSPDIFFHSLMRSNGPTVLLRNSDDFFPDSPDSHLWHLFCNSMNNIYTSHLNVLPDWDMFQTTLPSYAAVHAAGRCISGGPIYITDSPGQHSLPLIKLMAATSLRDPKRLVVLRPFHISLPVNPYIGYKSSHFLKLAAVIGTASILAVFNISASDHTELIPFKEFKGLEKKTGYVVRQHSTGKVFGPAADGAKTLLWPTLVLALELPVGGWEFLSAAPVYRCCGVNGWFFELGVLGLVSQLAGLAAVVETSVVDEGMVTIVEVSLMALGVLGIYISDLESRKIGDMFMTMEGRPVPVRTVRKSEKDPQVLEADVEAAWKEIGLKAGWSGEVTVKLFLDKAGSGVWL